MVALGRGGGSYERGTPVRPAQTQPPYHARILDEVANSQFSVRGSCFKINSTATGGLTTTHHFLFPGVAEVHLLSGEWVKFDEGAFEGNKISNLKTGTQPFSEDVSNFKNGKITVFRIDAPY